MYAAGALNGTTKDSNDGRTLVAIGSEDGVWIGEFGNPQCEYA